MIKKIGDCSIELIRGDITALEVDAIVNAANNHLWMGAGVAGAIKRKGGRVIEDEAVRQGLIEVGEAVVTSAGALPSKYVIHAAGMGQDFKTDESKVRACTKNSLRRAEEKGISSIAFPAIGTGVGGLSFERCAEAMVGAAIDHLKKGSCLKRIIFALFDEKAYDAFKSALERASN